MLGYLNHDLCALFTDQFHKGKMDLRILFVFIVCAVVHVYGESMLDEEDKIVVLQAHNYYRSLAAESAADMEKLVSDYM